MRTYRGRRVDGTALVTVQESGGPEVPFLPDDSLWIVNHSPTGFEWGFGGSGAAQLAFALLLDGTAHPRMTQQRYQVFKWDVVQAWGDEWSITAEQIIQWVMRVEVLATGGTR